LGKVLVAVVLDEEEAEILEEIARREGHSDVGRVLEKALRTFLELGGSNTSSQALYLSRRVGRIQGSAYP